MLLSMLPHQSTIQPLTHRRLPMLSLLALLLLLLPLASPLAPLSPQARGGRRSLLLSTLSLPLLSLPSRSPAAPPTSVMSAELGYFPVLDRGSGEARFVSSPLAGASTPQAVRLAGSLREQGARLYVAYWCPHCQNTRAMFGRDAWEVLSKGGCVVECDARGLGGDPKLCGKRGVEGFPTFEGLGGKKGMVSGEMPLGRIAELAGFEPFDQELEPVLQGSSGACS